MHLLIYKKLYIRPLHEYIAFFVLYLNPVDYLMNE